MTYRAKARTEDGNELEFTGDLKQCVGWADNLMSHGGIVSVTIKRVENE